MPQPEQLNHIQFNPDSSAATQNTARHVHLLFIGLSSEEMAPLLALLRTPKISARGHQITTEEEFLTSLSERSWDMVICAPKEGKFKAVDAIKHIKRLDKDLPVIQLIPEACSEKKLQGLKNGISAIVALDKKELLLFQVRKELKNLEDRRQLRKTRAALEKAEKRNLQLTASSKDAIVCCLNNQVIYANESFLDLFGEFEEKNVLSRDITERFITEDQIKLQEHLTDLNQSNLGEASFRATGLRTDQSVFDANLELAATTYQGEKAVRISIRVDEHLIDKSLNEDLNLISGLYNQDFLLRQLELIIQRSLDGGHDCSLLYIALNNHDDVLATISAEHKARYIREVASQLNKLVEHPHLLTHLDDTVFAIVLFEPSADKTQQFAEKLVEQITQLNTKIADNEVKSTCSVGIALINDSSPPPVELIAHAASASQELRSSSEGGNGVKLYLAANSFEQDENEMMRVSRAVESGQLKLLFQPVVNLTAEKPEAHYEVLLRMLGEEETEISPNEFRNAMRDPQTAIKVDRWVLENCLSALSSPLDTKQKNILFINLSVHCLDNKELLIWLRDSLKENQFQPEQLVFQLSNSDVAIAPKKARMFAKFTHEQNCRICIKHFGSGPYDKEVLRKIDADYIKLDGLFIQELGKDRNQDHHFFTLLDNLAEMNKITIAPLVEDSKAMVTLWKAGVSYVQGYYLQPPRHEMDYDFFAK